ncbi:MAG: hypothetical protein ACXWKI_12800 [Ramlibacter sp.]
MPGSLMRLLDSVVRSGLPSILVVNGRGTVSVYPRQHCYVTDVQDWDSVDTASGDEIRVSPSTWDAPPDDAQPLEELEWRLAYRDALRHGDLDAHALLHLKSWPNLPRLPDELVEPVARICALLWRKPTVGYLIPRVLDLPADQVAHVLRVLQAFGHVSGPSVAAADAAAGLATAADAGTDVPAPVGATIASRFLQRLLRLQAA